VLPIKIDQPYDCCTAFASTGKNETGRVRVAGIKAWNIAIPAKAPAILNAM